jgi:signal transduction histidine kinase
LFPLGLGLIPVALLGLVVLFAAFVIAQGGAMLERELAGALLGTKIDPPVRRTRTGTGPFSYFWNRLVDPVTWKELVFLVLRFPLGLASFVAATALWFVAFAGVFSFVWVPAAVRGHDETMIMWARGPDPAFGELALNMATGLVALLLVPWVMRAFALIHTGAAQVLLGRSGREQELEEEVERLADSRSRSVDVATGERARIERDLHDGAQARLLSLAVDLGRARDRLESEGHEGEAVNLVGEAHEQAKQALVELRDLARGIHPAVLTDRGLDAALSSLAARSPVPVRLDTDLPERPSPRIEAVAYFVLSELLVNVAHHSRATGVDVMVRRDGERLALVVEDDGVGGADPSVGRGLAGLVDRVQSVDGDLRVTSPVGGPTVVRVDLPFT